MLIAVTGGIGSGKTVVLNMVSRLGGRVLSADEISREMYLDENFCSVIKNAFPDVVDENGKILKKKLGERVFNDKVALEKLNSITHPIIMREIFNRASRISGNIFVEIPLFCESGAKNIFDRVWLVVADEKLRRQRTVLRDSVSEKYVESVMKNQALESELRKYATDVIENFSTEQALFEKVERLYNGLQG